MRLPVERVRSRAEAARTRKQMWRSIIDLCWMYAAPGMNPLVNGQDYDMSGGANAAATNPLYDGTLGRAVRRHCERMAFEVFPAGRHWAQLIEGPTFAPGEESTTARRRMLSRLQYEIFEALNASNFYLAVTQLALDGGISGTGLMRVGGSPDPSRRLSFEPVNQARVAFEGGPRGEIWGFYRYLWLTDMEIYALWPGSGWQRDENKSDRSRTEVLDATYYDPWTGIWYYDVIAKTDAGDRRIVEEDLLVCPWVAWRYSLIAGQVQGYSPTMEALPDVRTANFAVKVRLKSASVRQAGMFTVDSNSSFNPDTMNFDEPGIFIPVESNRRDDPTIQPLALSGDVSLNEIVLADQREQINKTFLVDMLPPVSGAVRSATEIIERQRENMIALGSPYLRMAEEVGRPVLRAVTYELLRQEGGLEGLEPAVVRDRASGKPIPYMLDGTDIGVSFVSPLTTAQELSDAERVARWADIGQRSAGMQAWQAGAKVEDFAEVLGELMSVPPRLVREEGERADMLQQTMAGAMEPEPAPIA